MIQFIENIDISFRYQYIKSAASISIFSIYCPIFVFENWSYIPRQ